VKRAGAGQKDAMRRPLAAVPLLAAVAAALGGCAGGTPIPDQAKAAARAWATSHLHPSQTLEVSDVAVARDERRARVSLHVDGRGYRLRLLRPGEDWRVVSAGPE
jgi:hypothetical protein